MIDAIENGTKVPTPTGHTGRVFVTRRERRLISEDKLDHVKVEGTDGLFRRFNFNELTDVIEESEDLDNEIKKD